MMHLIEHRQQHSTAQRHCQHKTSGDAEDPYHVTYERQTDSAAAALAPSARSWQALQLHSQGAKAHAF
jgi:hypothetical protein